MDKGDKLILPGLRHEVYEGDLQKVSSLVVGLCGQGPWPERRKQKLPLILDIEYAYGVLKGNEFELVQDGPHVLVLNHSGGGRTGQRVGRYNLIAKTAIWKNVYTSHGGGYTRESQIIVREDFSVRTISRSWTPFTEVENGDYQEWQPK